MNLYRLLPSTSSITFVLTENVDGTDKSDTSPFPHQKTADMTTMSCLNYEVNKQHFNRIKQIRTFLVVCHFLKYLLTVVFSKQTGGNSAFVGDYF